MDTTIIHPMMVHFPIALTLVGFFLEMLAAKLSIDSFFAKAATTLLLFGTLGAIAASISGAFTPNLSGELLQTENIHHYFAMATTVLLCLASIVYVYIRILKKSDSVVLLRIGFTLYALAALSVSITGYYGGYLVYNEGVL